MKFRTLSLLALSLLVGSSSLALNRHSDLTVDSLTATGTLTGNASTATALAADPADCAANNFATTIGANGALTCSTIPNAATTATSANTNSAIVTRDGSGNFAAGTVTANLTGNVTGAVTGNASTATALAANPTDCGVNTFATTIDASGNLTCASGGGNLAVSTETTTVTLAISDDLVLADATGGAFTITLPTAAGNDGKVFRIKKIDSSTNAVTVDGGGAETIDGETAKILLMQFEALTIASDGTNWQTAASFNANAVSTLSERARHFGAAVTAACTASPCTVAREIGGDWISSMTRGATGVYTVTVNNGIFDAAPTCTCTVHRTSALAAIGDCGVSVGSATSITINTARTDTGVLDDIGSHFNLMCTGTY